MARNCIMCGNKIGMLETINRDLPEDGCNRGTCFECHNFFRENVKYPTEKCDDFASFDKLIAEIEKQPYQEEGIKYMRDYVLLEKNAFSREVTKRKVSEQLNENISGHQLTTAYFFEGYKITTHHGIVSGDAVLGTGFFSEFSASISDLFGTQSNTFADKMIEVKNAAKQRLIIQSVELGGNAVIGVDFDYITFGNNMIGVSANGTSVTIEKI